MLTQDCFEAATPPTPVDAGTAAKWFLIAWVGALVVFEIWALLTHHNTISHWLQRMALAHRWVRVLGVVLTVLAAWHLFWGF